MSDTAIATPKHVWIVGVLSLLWNSIGVLDYTMTRFKLMELPAAQLDYINAFPAWASAGWALGVWGAFAGSILFLMRSGHAVAAFGISLAGMFVSLLWRFVLSGVDETAVLGGSPYPMAAFIAAVAIALFLYALRQKAAGVLR